MTPPGRAVTDEQKRAVVERLLAAWLDMPELRFGQMLVVATNRSPCGLFHLEDARLVDAVESLEE